MLKPSEVVILVFWDMLTFEPLALCPGLIFPLSAFPERMERFTEEQCRRVFDLLAT
jgi:hypothetical protein